jgi:hypothetical protein
MWLINVNTMKLEFFQESRLPPYGILSHTWGQHEPSFRDLDDWSLIKSKPGAQKIASTCRQAKTDQLNYAWVDTCCIDQKSSAELAEAINSMFLWYKKADRCYAFLEDVRKEQFDEQFPKSRWFTRGWTLQELIAPRSLDFYDSEWRHIGSKHLLIQKITTMTKIDKDSLTGADLEIVSIAKRMSWAANREITRVEDLAYCLLGIFNINMPMLYGEGEHAFQRLQEEIFRSSYKDQSLFAWGIPSDMRIINADAFLPTVLGLGPYSATIRTEWAEEVHTDQLQKHKSEQSSLQWLFARSPADFKESGRIVPTSHWHGNSWRFPTPALSGGVIRLTLPCFISLKYRDSFMVAFTGCYVEHTNIMIGLILKHWSSDTVGRFNEAIGIPSTMPELVRIFWPSFKSISFATPPSHMLENRVSALVHIHHTSLSRHGYKLTKVICSSTSSWNGSSELLLDWFQYGRKAILIFHSDTGHMLWILIACIQENLFLRGGFLKSSATFDVPLNEVLPPFLVMESPSSVLRPSEYDFVPKCFYRHETCENRCRSDADLVFEHGTSRLISFRENRWAHKINVPNRKSLHSISAEISSRPMPLLKYCERECNLDLDFHKMTDQVITPRGRESNSSTSQVSQNKNHRNKNVNKINDYDDEWTSTASEDSGAVVRKNIYRRAKQHTRRLVRFRKRSPS